ncbi:hypothetical protein PInf_016626 [Phytophthora infestans]|nr:hypothetical protein PInf_016626 [Phytophthora infestans]
MPNRNRLVPPCVPNDSLSQLVAEGRCVAVGTNHHFLGVLRSRSLVKALGALVVLVLTKVVVVVLLAGDLLGVLEGRLLLLDVVLAVVLLLKVQAVLLDRDEAWGSSYPNQLRKECTSRNLRLSRQTSAEERIKHLVGFDELHRSMVASTLESGGGTGNSKAYPSKNSCVRLLTILFSDKYATRFAETGNKPTRQQLDASDTHANSIFWRDVALDFNGNRMDFNTLLSDDTVNQSYVKAMARFTKSGEHGDDFYSFCAGALDVFYLRECLQLKHNLTQFVEGGMFDEDQFDSLKRRSSAVAAVDTTSTPSKKMRNEIVESMKAMTEKVCGKETSLIQHVETRIDELSAVGKPTARLEGSLQCYLAKLSEMETHLN